MFNSLFSFNFNGAELRILLLIKTSSFCLSEINAFVTKALPLIDTHTPFFCLFIAYILPITFQMFLEINVSISVPLSRFVLHFLGSNNYCPVLHSLCKNQNTTLHRLLLLYNRLCITRELQAGCVDYS